MTREKLLIFSVILVFGVSLISGCSKSEESADPLTVQNNNNNNNPSDTITPPPPPPPPPPPSTDTMDMVTSQTWIVEKAKPGGVDFPGHPAQGTTLKFNKDGTYKWICGPDWISEEGTWGFTDSKKKLTRTYNDGAKTYTKEWTINEISSDRLVVREVIWGFVFEFRH